MLAADAARPLLGNAAPHDAGIGQSLGAAQAWLGGLSLAMRRRAFSERSLQCLLGLWICARALEAEPSRGLAALAGVVSQQLAPLQEAAISSCDAKLLLLALHILRTLGLAADGLERYARKVADALRGAGEARKDHLGEVIILSHLGLAAYPGGDGGEPWLTPRAARELLAADAEAIRGLHARICAATHFGTRTGRRLPQHREIAYAVRVLLIDALNRYDIATGAILLRLAAYLDPASAVIRDARSFLTLQQLPDGRFGQYGLHAAALRDAGLDASLDLHLPLTVSCVWALAESAIPRFRLLALG